MMTIHTYIKTILHIVPVKNTAHPAKQFVARVLEYYYGKQLKYEYKKRVINHVTSPGVIPSMCFVCACSAEGVNGRA